MPDQVLKCKHRSSGRSWIRALIFSSYSRVYFLGRPDFGLGFNPSSPSLLNEKHEEMPTGLVPSILFKSIRLSLPVYGDKNEILKRLPEIRVREADFMNVAIKKKRYEQRDRKNYLVALIFEELLKSGSIDEFEFDGVRLARKIGLKEIAEELENLY